MTWRRGAALMLSGAYLVAIVAVTLTVVGEQTAGVLAPVVVAATWRRVSRAARRITGADRSPQDALLELAAALAEAHDPEAAVEHLCERIAAATAAGRAWVEVDASGDLAPDTVRVPLPGGVSGRHSALVLQRGDQGLPPAAVLEALAAQIAPALENRQAREALVQRVQELEKLADDLRESRRRVVEIGDSERRVLERDLHDGAQQCLMALVLRLGLRRSAADDEVIDQLLARARSTLVEASGGWATAGLERQGLVEALRRHTQSLADDGPRVTVTSSPLPRLPDAVARAIFFACVEGVQNALKHGSPRVIAVSLAVRSGRVSFIVTDDGRGFDASRRGLGSGLGGLRERVEALGGALDLDSAPGIGTVLAGDVPVGEEVAA